MTKLRSRRGVAVAVGLIALVAGGVALAVNPAIRINALQITSLSASTCESGKPCVWVKSTTPPSLRYEDGTNHHVVPSAALTTKGDLIGWTGTAFARHAVGADGTVIVADSGQADGWAWGSPTASVTADSPLSGSGTSGSHLACPTCVTGTPTATGDLLYSTSGSQGVSPIADVSAGSYLRSGGAGVAPGYSTLKLPNTATAGDTFVATSSNTMGVVAACAANTLLVGQGAGSAPTCGTVPNAALANSSVTVSAGTGMSGGGSVSLGGSVTLTNAGVTSLTGGGGVTVSASTGGVTLGASGIAESAITNLTTDLSAKLDASSSKLPPTPSAAGKILYDNGSAYVALAAGTSGYVLQANGASAPTWVAPSGGVTGQTSASGTVTTTNNSNTTCLTLTVASNTAISADVNIVGYRTDVAGQGYAFLLHVFARNISGTTTVTSNSPGFSALNSDDAMTNATANNSGTDAVVQVRGNTGKTVNWRCSAVITTAS